MKSTAGMAPLLLLRAVAYGTIQNFDNAIDDLSICLQIDSTSSLAYWQRAVCQAMINEFNASQGTNIDLKSANVLGDPIQQAPQNPYSTMTAPPSMPSATTTSGPSTTIRGPSSSRNAWPRPGTTEVWPNSMPSASTRASPTSPKPANWASIRLIVSLKNTGSKPISAFFSNFLGCNFVISKKICNFAAQISNHKFPRWTSARMLRRILYINIKVSSLNQVMTPSCVI